MNGWTDDQKEKLHTLMRNEGILSNVLTLLDEIDDDEYFMDADNPYDVLDDAYDTIEKLRDGLFDEIKIMFGVKE